MHLEHSIRNELRVYLLNPSLTVDNAVSVMGVGGETKDQDGGTDNAQSGARRVIDLRECLQDAPSFR